MFHRRAATTTRTKPSLMTRLRGPNARKKTVKTTTTTNGHPSTRRSHGLSHGTHRRRRSSIGDKVSGAMLKLKGSLTRRAGLKVRSSSDDDGVS